MNRLVVQESEDTYHKGITLKACKQQQDSSASDEDTMNLLSRKFSKFLKKKKKSQTSKRYGSKKKPMILILTNELVMAVLNRVISRQNASIVKSKKKQISKM